MEVDPNDPALWSEAQLASWFAEQGVVGLDGLTGLQFCAMPEPEIFSKLGDDALASKV